MLKREMTLPTLTRFACETQNVFGLATLRECKLGREEDRPAQVTQV